MKKTNCSGLLLCVIIISTFSCTKNQSIKEGQTVGKDYGIISPRTFRLNNSDASGRQLPSSTVFVTLNNGNFISSYQSGITFGSSLPHPTTADPTGLHDGEAIPTIGYVGIPSGTEIAGTIHGSYFDVLVPTMSGSIPSGPLSTYRANLNKFWDSLFTAAPAPFMQTTPGVVVMEIKGMLVRDHTSPTLMSVCSDSWKGNFLEIATIFKSPYTIKFYGPTYVNGTANGVYVTNNGTAVAVTSYSLSYYSYSNQNGDYLHVGGTVKLVNGTTLTINSDILLLA